MLNITIEFVDSSFEVFIFNERAPPLKIAVNQAHLVINDHVFDMKKIASFNFISDWDAEFDEALEKVQEFIEKNAKEDNE